MEGEYYWQLVRYLSEDPVPRVVRWYLETCQREGSIRNLTYTQRYKCVQISYEWRRRIGDADHTVPDTGVTR